MKKLFLFALLGIALQTTAQVKKVVADKIIATVGDKIILKSDIDNSIHDYQRQNIPLPPNAECLLLEQQLGVKALVVQAEKDSIPVSEEEVNAALDNQIRGFIQRFGSKEVVEQIAGKSIFQLKEDFRTAFREQKLAEGERNKIVDGIRITPDEVQTFFDKIPKDSLPFYESELEIGQIVLYPKPSRDVENYTINQLKEYKQEVEDGSKKFEVLASLYSDDPGTKKDGGLFEVNRNDKNVDPVFLAKAFSLKDGQISNVFKSRFGYHIIQMISRRGDDATVRHILKIPQVSSIEINTSTQTLDSVRNQLVSGKLKFGEAVAKYSEDESSKFTGGRISGANGSTSVTIDQLDPDLVKMFDVLKVGEYSQPVEYTDDRGKKAVRIIYLISKTEPHRENMKEDYDKITQRALEEKKNDALEKWFNEKVSTFYIHIDPDYIHCPEIKKWEGASVVSAKN